MMKLLLGTESSEQRPGEANRKRPSGNGKQLSVAEHNIPGIQCMYRTAHDNPQATSIPRGPLPAAEEWCLRTIFASAAGGGLMEPLHSEGLWSLGGPRAPFPHLINYSVKLHAVQHKISNEEPNGCGYNRDISSLHFECRSLFRLASGNKRRSVVLQNVCLTPSLVMLLLPGKL
ncbi:uncharacterized protein LOC115279272 isoform X3 [Suricata suricatta]|uniref:uncharacterized protein LOC115279272 isoform X3 n=2 Tax=Suricata suricatta TaxID=37032 RepID=UPI0011552D5F|nr:uncharacterized protein LOC115279272 isoform X3 [Suricata suricatta]